MANYKANEIKWETEAETTPISDDAESAGLISLRIYCGKVTLPTTEAFYKITGLEWKNGTVVAGDTIAGVDIIDELIPVRSATPTLAITSAVTNSGTSAVQRATSEVENLHLIPGGSNISMWILSSNTNQTYRVDTISSASVYKVETYVVHPSLMNTTGWSATTVRPYGKIYYQGLKIT